VTVHSEQSVKREKNQQDATNRSFLLTSVSTCFGHRYAHLQENKDHVTTFSVLLWFCWMWLVAVVGRCVVGCKQCCWGDSPWHAPYLLHIPARGHHVGRCPPQPVSVLWNAPNLSLSFLSAQAILEPNLFLCKYSNIFQI